eukprot:4513598-Alexandrium_andersonii.AAC.1
MPPVRHCPEVLCPVLCQRFHEAALTDLLAVPLNVQTAQLLEEVQNQRGRAPGGLRVLLCGRAAQREALTALATAGKCPESS